MKNKLFTFFATLLFASTAIAATSMTCTQAASAALSVSASGTLYNNGATYTVRGYVTYVYAYESSYRRMSFWISDVPNGGKVLEAFRCSINNEANAPKCGDLVEVTGQLTKYIGSGDTIPEFTSGCTCTIITRDDGSTPFSGGTIQIGDLYYNLDGVAQTAEVTYQAKMIHNYDNLTSVSIPSSVSYLGTTYLVTSIGREAFNYCKKLTSVTIPNSVTSIGYESFFSCYSLTSVTIPQNVTSIDDMAFWLCNNLTSVVWNAINCNGYIFGDQVTSFTFGANVEVIPDGICYGMDKLSSISIPNSVTSIGQKAFSDCTGLTSVNIGNSVTSIGDQAFYNCTGLTSVTIGNSVTSIGDRAFGRCDNLTSIIVPCGELERFRQMYSDSRFQYIPSPYIISAIQTSNGYIDIPSYSSCDDSILVEAHPYTNYHFVRWTDGNIKNPRIIYLTQDVTVEAVFARNPIITYVFDSKEGYVSGATTTPTGIAADSITFEAVPNENYHFVKWSDGNTDNPRTIILTQDTTFTALFAINTYLVQFFGFNEELLDRQSVDHGTAAVAPEAPIVDHYDFVGWDKEFTNVTSNLDIYAIYQRNIEDVENVNIDALPYKVMIDGQIYILRGEKVYTLQGQEVR